MVAVDPRLTGRRSDAGDGDRDDAVAA